MNLFDLPLEELRSYNPEIEKKADFDSFWDSTLAESSAQPLNAAMEPFDYPVPGVECFNVRFDGFRNSRASARYVRPAGAASSKGQIPALVCYHGYNWNTLTVAAALKYVMLGRSVLLVDVRGQNPAFPDLAPYPNGGASGWMTLGILDPASYYYRNVYMDSVRAVDFVASLPETDPADIAVEGGSQGGALTLATAALSPRVALALADVPYLCHFRRAVKISTEGPYDEIYHYFKIHDQLHLTEEKAYETLSYFDVCNLAPRIRGRALVSVGLEDAICPPSTVFAAYNRIPGDKEIRVYPDYGHGGFSRHDEEKIAFLARGK